MVKMDTYSLIFFSPGCLGIPMALCRSALAHLHAKSVRTITVSFETGTDGRGMVVEGIIGAGSR